MNGFKFSNFDATHYLTIREELYHGSSSQFEAAFFPGFPLFWKFLHLDDFGISLLNAILGLIAFYFLTKDLWLTRLEKLMIMAIPSFLFLTVPYSESLFLLLLAGYGWSVKSKKYWWMLFFLALASFTRSAINIMLPALIITEILLSKERRDLKRLLFSGIGLIIGLIAVLIIQYIEMNEWFVYLKAQSLWGHKLQIPNLPFTTWDGYMVSKWVISYVISLDAFAMLIGLISIVITFNFFLKWLRMKQRSIDFLQLFGIISISGFTLFALLFKGGLLFSLNRYIFPTAMFFWMLSYTKNVKLTKKQTVYFYLIMSFIMVISFKIVHLPEGILYLLFPIFSLLILFKPKNIESKIISSNLVLTISYIIFSIGQSWFLLRYLSGSWVA